MQKVGPSEALAAVAPLVFPDFGLRLGSLSVLVRP